MEEGDPLVRPSQWRVGKVYKGWMEDMKHLLMGRRKVGAFRESTLPPLLQMADWLINGARSSLRRKSLQVGKSLTHSVGGYLPNTLTEMWEPSRDFAFLRLPTSGARCIVALSGYVAIT